MEHRIILGGEQYLPFARNCVAKLKKLGLKYASQTFKVDGVTISVEITPGHDYIRLEGGEFPLYQFFTTGARTQTKSSFGEVTRGYALSVKLDKKTKTLKATATGSTLERSTDNPPKWKFAANPLAISSFLDFQIAFQVSGLNQHQFFPNAEGPRFIEDGWVSAGQLVDITGKGLQAVTPYSYDIGYDAALGILSKKGKPRGVFGLAPDADWYRRGASQRVENPDKPEYGSRFFLMLTDTSGNFYVYPAGEFDIDLRLQSPYVSQQIKTNIADDVVNKQKLPYPAWARPFAALEDREILRAAGGFGFSHRPEHAGMRWEFSSDGKRMVCLIPSDLPEPVNGTLRYEPEKSGKPIDAIESKPGMLELEIEITLTGPEPRDFDVTLTVTNEVKPTDEQYIIAAQYYWGDIKDAHTPTGLEKDELVVMDLSVFHKRNAPVDGSEPPYSAVRSIAQVKSFATGNLIREFTTHWADAPLGMASGPYTPIVGRDDIAGGTLLNDYYYEATEGVALIAREMNKSFLVIGSPTVASNIVASFLDEIQPYNAAITEVTPGHLTWMDNKTQKCLDALYDHLEAAGFEKGIEWVVRTNLTNTQFRLSGIMEATPDAANVMTSLLSYDLRALAFAVQTSAFKNEGVDITRQDRIQVIVRNEVVHTVDPPSPEFKALAESSDAAWTPGGWTKLDHREMMNPSKSLLAFRSFSYAKASTSGNSPYPLIRSDANLDMPVGASVYNLRALSFICGDPFDVFCVHPAGHWSLTTRPLVYYSGVSKHLRYGWRHHSEVTDAIPDATKFTQNMIDIISVQVVEEDATYAIKSSHLELFNQAYGKNLKIEDFYFQFENISRPVFGDRKLENTRIINKTASPVTWAEFITVLHRPVVTAWRGGSTSIRMSDVTAPVPTCYMDLRNYLYAGLVDKMGALSDGGSVGGSIFQILPVRYEAALPVLRGTAFFGGTTIKLK